ncbi:MAG: leucine-rich repeat domain-containing protein [Acutalibacteraceae bacterium]
MKKKSFKFLKRALACALVVVMTLTAAPLSGLVGLELPKWNVAEWFSGKASALSSSGTCGENVTYTYDSSTGELVISGTGEMDDYDSGMSPFRNSSIKSVVIEDGVTSIGDYAFPICKTLTSITIGNSVTSIGFRAFISCSGLKSITIPDSVTSIGHSAFIECTGLTSVTISDSVTSIEDMAFYMCTGLTSITIPDSVTSIGSSAFNGCTGLTSITIPDSVTSIGGNTFYNTAWYNAQPDGDLYAGKFYYEYKGTMPGNTSIVIKDGTKGIAGAAFKDCTGLTSITIPNSVTSIGNYAFYYCTGLTSVAIPNSVTSIGVYAFYYCTGLTSVAIPNSVTSIGAYAFSDCTRLTSVTIPDSVTSIGYEAFNDCTALKYITIPGSVANIGELAFYNTAWYNAQPNGDLYAGKVYYQYKGTMPENTDIAIKDGTKGIAGAAFKNCTGLTSITIPNSVTSIGNCAFEDCINLTSITIPDSVTYINSYAFDNCTSLKDVYYSGSEADWKKITIDSYNEALTNATIHYNSIITYTLSGTLDSYDWTVELNGDDAWISSVTVNGRKHAVQKNLLTENLDKYKNEKVILKVQNKEVVYFKPFSTVRTNVSCTVARDGEELSYCKKKFSSSEVKLSLDIYNNLKESTACLNELSKTSDYDLNISEVTLKTSNKEILNFSGKAQKIIALNKSVKIGGEMHETLTVDVNKSYKIPSDKKQEDIIITCIVSGTKNGNDFLSTTETKITVINKDYEEPVNTSSETSAYAKKAAEALSKITGAAAIENASLNKLFTREQLDAIQELILCEVVMSKTPEERLKNYLSTKVIEKVLSINTKVLECKQDEIRITIAKDTEHGEVEVAFVCNFNRHSVMGNEYGFNGDIDYEIVGGKGEKKLPSDIEKSGYAGSLYAANATAFCEAAYSVVESCIKSIYNTAWGNDANTVADMIFGKSVNQILSHTKYNSVSGIAWVIMTTPAKKVKVECPVDVYVYNSNGELVAVVENNEVTRTDENAQITVNGDVKEILLFDESYSIVYEATAEGAMRVTVDEYANSEDRLRTTVTEDIPLSVGTVYNQAVDSEYLNDSDYSLTSNEETVYAPTVDELTFHSHVSDGEWFDGEKATCTMDGYHYSMCSVCGDWFIEITEPAAGHKETIDPGVAPTCTESGLTDGSHCSVCNTVLVKQEIIPATGHNDGNSDGICDNCGEDLGTHNPSETCTCMCHKTGFAGFIYKLIRIFWKLFKTNKTCACGVSHY